MFKVIIAGSRDFKNYELLQAKLDTLLQDKTDIQIVSGKAQGADRLGEKYAKENGYPIKEFPAQWDKYEKSAGMIRNNEMAKYADACVCFWNGKSKGTAHMLKIATKNNLLMRVIRY